MIIKSFELKNKNILNYKFFLLYGANDGHKKQIIDNIFLNEKEEVEILKYEEEEILSDKNLIIESLYNKSLFTKKKILIVSRTTDKIINFIEDLLEKDAEDIRIIFKSGTLEKKSKLRTLFEKSKFLVCTPFYEDDNKNLQLIIENFLTKKKINFSQEAINVMISRSKGDRGNLFNELSKIENLIKTKKNVSFEDINKLTNLSENYSVFELSDNYLAKNSRKVSNILNENNYSSDDCMLILRTILNKSKRLLKLKYEDEKNNNIELTLSLFKPSIFWKEKEIVKKQMKSWQTKEVKKIIYKINDLEMLIKKNNTNSINFISDFIRNY